MTRDTASAAGALIALVRGEMPRAAVERRLGELELRSAPPEPDQTERRWRAFVERALADAGVDVLEPATRRAVARIARAVAAERR